MHTNSDYNSKVLAAHPDKGGSSAAFQRVMLAFETLSSGDNDDSHKINEM